VLKRGLLAQGEASACPPLVVLSTWEVAPLEEAGPLRLANCLKRSLFIPQVDDEEGNEFKKRCKMMPYN
jgi:hypothetical protein